MSILDYAVILTYLAGMLGLGYYFRQQRDDQDYFLGGRSFGWFAVGLSVMATQLSAVSFISVPAFVGARPGGGLQWVTTELHAPLTMIVLMVFLIPPLYRSGVISIYAFLERRLGRSSRRLVGAIFMVNRALATGIMVSSVHLILSAALGFSFVTSLVSIGLITVVYSWQGGMQAVVYGDAVQMIILFIGMVVCAVAGATELGGWEGWLAAINPDRTVALDFDAIGVGGDGDFGFWPLLIGGMFISVAYYGTDQSEAQRLLGSKDLPTLRRSLLFVGLTRYPVMLLYGILGLIIAPVVLSNTDFAATVATDPDRMVPIFIVEYLPSGLRGILIVAILAAAMSSLSSAVNSLSAVSVRDYLEPRGWVRGGVATSRALSVFWGAVILTVTTLMTYVAQGKTLIELIAQLGSVSFSAILGVFVLAIATPRARALTGNLALVVGILTNLALWFFLGDRLFWLWWNVTGLVAACLAAFVLHRLLGPAPLAPGEQLDVRPDWEALRSWESLVLVAFFFLVLYVSYMWPVWLA